MMLWLHYIEKCQLSHASSVDAMNALYGWCTQDVIRYGDRGSASSCVWARSQSEIYYFMQYLMRLCNLHMCTQCIQVHPCGIMKLSRGVCMCGWTIYLNLFYYHFYWVVPFIMSHLLTIKMQMAHADSGRSSPGRASCHHITPVIVYDPFGVRLQLKLMCALCTVHWSDVAKYNRIEFIHKYLIGEFGELGIRHSTVNSFRLLRKVVA